jgi:hypothetical protein
MPVYYQFVECLSLPTHFRPATQRGVVTTFRANRYVNRDAGAIPAASTFCIINICIAKTYVLRGRGLVSRRPGFLARRSRRRERRKMHGDSSLYPFRSRCLYRKRRRETASDV